MGQTEDDGKSEMGTQDFLNRDGMTKKRQWRV